MSNPAPESLSTALQGDEEAFATLVEFYQTPVFNLCYRMLGDAQEAEDAAQETFWRAYQALKRYDSARPFITWLLSIAAHYCIDQQRKRHLPMVDLEILPEETIPNAAPNPERTVNQREQESLLRGLLKHLKPQDRAAVIMRYWYDFSEMEIAEALSLSVSAVKSRLHRARLLLAKQWKNLQPNPVLKEEAA